MGRNTRLTKADLSHFSQFSRTKSPPVAGILFQWVTGCGVWPRLMQDCQLWTLALELAPWEGAEMNSGALLPDKASLHQSRLHKSKWRVMLKKWAFHRAPLLSGALPTDLYPPSWRQDECGGRLQRAEAVMMQLHSVYTCLGSLTLLPLNLGNRAALATLLPNKDPCDTTISESQWKLEDKAM